MALHCTITRKTWKPTANRRSRRQELARCLKSDFTEPVSFRASSFVWVRPLRKPMDPTPVIGPNFAQERFSNAAGEIYRPARRRCVTGDSRAVSGRLAEKGGGGWCWLSEWVRVAHASGASDGGRVPTHDKTTYRGPVRGLEGVGPGGARHLPFFRPDSSCSIT